MGKIEDGFTGGFSGKLGNVVGYMWRGQWCVRALPAQYHDAQTVPQLEHRNLFRQTVAFAGNAKVVLRTGLRMASKNSHLTECNYFMRINKGCFALADGKLEVDYASLVVSEGPVAPVAFDAPQLVDETTISISFEKNPLHKATKQDDKVYLAVCCPELNAFILSDPVYRNERHLTISLPSVMAGKEVHLYGFVQDFVGRTSMSQYIGCGVLALETSEDDVFTPEDDDDSDLFETEGEAVARPTAGGAGNDTATADFVQKPPKDGSGGHT